MRFHRLTCIIYLFESKRVITWKFILRLKRYEILQSESFGSASQSAENLGGEWTKETVDLINLGISLCILDCTQSCLKSVYAMQIEQVQYYCNYILVRLPFKMQVTQLHFSELPAKAITQVSRTMKNARRKSNTNQKSWIGTADGVLSQRWRFQSLLSAQAVGVAILTSRGLQMYTFPRFIHIQMHLQNVVAAVWSLNA